MEKKRIKKVIKSDIDLCGSLKNAIKYLQKMEKLHSKEYIALSIEHQGSYDYTQIDLVGIREETDGELAKRIAIAKLKEQTRKANKLKKIKQLQKELGMDEE